MHQQALPEERRALPLQLEDRRELPLRPEEEPHPVAPPVEAHLQAARPGDARVAPLAATVRCPRVIKRSHSGVAEALTLTSAAGSAKYTGTIWTSIAA